ncbi:MAG: sarcosine oxidase subunit delta [Notoacmeibacter sp.]
MRIDCPHCGPRDVVEFSYAGDANRLRPDPSSTDLTVWNDYVFNRVNTRGRHHEFWQHNHGCRAHLIVERDSVSHEIFKVEPAKKPTTNIVKLPRKKAVKS